MKNGTTALWTLLIIGLSLSAGQAFAVPSTGSVVPLAPVASCASLAQTALANDVGADVQIRRAEEHSLEGARYCQIEGTIDHRIKFELRLPVAGWTQRYVQVGCGGLCGVLQVHLEHADDCQPVRDHAVALASTDMGHEGRYMGDGTFGRDPQARIDFAYRGVHLTTLASKALIRRYYGHPAKFSYFSGCSDGGREALMEAQRYPTDFDGIAAGAPAMNFQVQNTFYHAWMYRANHRADGSAILTASKLPALHAAALAACDAIDGLRDGLISEPRACHFNPADAQCKVGDPPGDRCLSAEEVDVARKFYEGPRDAAGHRFTIGGPQVGSELAWRGVYVPDTATGKVLSDDAALGTLRFLAFTHNPSPNYELREFQFDQATFQQLAALHPLYDATDTDLSGFERRGGKLILWHGWSDPHISPINTIAYYRGVREHVGAERSDGFMRLFLFPGLYHCGGGDGFASFDILSPLMAWVEHGAAPDHILASTARFNPPMGPPPGGPVGAGMPPPGMPPPGMRPGDMPEGMPPAAGDRGPPLPTRTRPIYAYPATAGYAGKGSVDAAASFVPRGPLYTEPTRYDWEGAAFMTPSFHKDCVVEHQDLVCH